jgi:hypothetical protein
MQRVLHQYRKLEEELYMQRVDSERKQNDVMARINEIARLMQMQLHQLSSQQREEYE